MAKRLNRVEALDVALSSLAQHVEPTITTPEDIIEFQALCREALSVLSELRLMLALVRDVCPDASE
jgi:hypothetical protein